MAMVRDRNGRETQDFMTVIRVSPRCAVTEVYGGMVGIGGRS